jgi:energy-coupling factor transport system ATP-binding protein
MNPEQPLIDMRNVSFSYEEDIRALAEVSLKITDGEFVAFVGQNGAGKTTCAKHLNGILKPTKGEVWIAGSRTDEVAASELAQTVGYCYQNPDHQIWALRVEDELAFGPRNLGLSPEEVKQRVEEALALVDLGDRRDEYTFSLGWGERQKMAVASILAMRPRVIVVDEPTTGLDWGGSTRIMDLLADLNTGGLTVIIITHDMPIATAYTGRSIVFAGGRIVRDGPTSEVMRDLAALEQADLRPPQFVRVALALESQGFRTSARTPDGLASDIRRALEKRQRVE